MQLNWHLRVCYCWHCHESEFYLESSSLQLRYPLLETYRNMVSGCVCSLIFKYFTRGVVFILQVVWSQLGCTWETDLSSSKQCPEVWVLYSTWVYFLSLLLPAEWQTPFHLKIHILSICFYSLSIPGTLPQWEKLYLPSKPTPGDSTKWPCELASSMETNWPGSLTPSLSSLWSSHISRQNLLPCLLQY